MKAKNCYNLLQARCLGRTCKQVMCLQILYFLCFIEYFVLAIRIEKCSNFAKGTIFNKADNSSYLRHLPEFHWSLLKLTSFVYHMLHTAMY